MIDKGPVFRGEHFTALKLKKLIIKLAVGKPGHMASAKNQMVSLTLRNHALQSWNMLLLLLDKSRNGPLAF